MIVRHTEAMKTNFSLIKFTINFHFVNEEKITKKFARVLKIVSANQQQMKMKTKIDFSNSSFAEREL